VSQTPPHIPSSPQKTSSKNGSLSSSADPISGDVREIEKIPDEAETPAKRDATPDIISSSPEKEVPREMSNGTAPEEGVEDKLEVEKEDVSGSPCPPEEKADRESSPNEKREEQGSEGEAGKKIISSEEEAKARLAEKRREMKEKKEREAELERQRLVSGILLRFIDTVG